jgi:HlyD family secretion protein
MARNRWLVWSVGIILAVIILASFMSKDDTVPIRAAKVQRGTIRSLISTNGKVEPVENFEAHAPIGTVVKRVLIHEGEHVKKGQLLVVLNDAEARDQSARAMAQVRGSQADISALQTGGTQEEVLTAQSELSKAQTGRDQAQRNLDALKKLQQSGAASSGEVIAAQNELARYDSDVKLLQQKLKDRYSKPEVAKVEAQQDQAKAAYAAAQDILSRLNVRAPVDGVVYWLPVKQGVYVNPGDLILQEADLSRVLVRAFVDEPDVGRLSNGDPVEVTWDGLPGRLWSSAIRNIPSTVRLRGTRTVGETTCIVENPDYRLLPNTNVGITIVTAEDHDVLTVPREAIRQNDSKPYVFEVVKDSLVRRDVQTSISNLTEVEVSKGLNAQALVALASVNSKPLKQGLSVKVVP